MKKRNGFTLVELLAVIVILAIILVIAVPQILSTIDDATEGSMVSSAKMVASAAETQYLTAQAKGDTFDLNGTCGTWAGLNTTDYSGCTYTIDSDSGVATVKLTGSGKFAGLYVCNATKTAASVSKTACS